jgi:hypothetical protein
MAGKVADPFADGAVEAHDDGTAKGKMDHAHAKEAPPTVDFEVVIRRLAEIEDEIVRRGVEDLLAEKEELRKTLKDAMKRARSEEEYDEVSGHEAVLVQRTADVWDVGKFRDGLTAAQRKRYLVEAIADGAVRDGIKNGDLSRGELESNGSVTKVPGSLALYVRERKEDNDEVT